MPIYDLFSKRKKKQEKSGLFDVYKYNDIPQTFRVQVIHIWRSALGPFVDLSGSYTYQDEPVSNELWRLVFKSLTRELGVFELDRRDIAPDRQCDAYILHADVDDVLNIIELVFRVIDRAARDVDPNQRQRASIDEDPDDAIQELNHRFQEHGIGYRYEGGKIIRVDTEYVHSEVVRPALSLLQDSGFKGAAEEFLRAHEHYRKGRSKEAIQEALKAFESTMKTICDLRMWPYPKSATAKPLIDLLMKQGIIPSELECHFTGLRSAMESGLPTIRNISSGHGQGIVPVSVPNHWVAHALHLAAANIVFLVESHKAA